MTAISSTSGYARALFSERKKDFGPLREIPLTKEFPSSGWEMVVWLLCSYKDLILDPMSEC